MSRRSGASLAALGAAFGFVLFADRILGRREVALLVGGALDETAHEATTALLLAGVGAPRDAAFRAGAALGSVALDADHVPHLFGRPITGTESERPFTHSFPAFVLAVAAVALAGGERRRAALGFLCGLASHVFRDLASASGGVPLWWPLSGRDVRIPRWLYVGALAVLLSTRVVGGATLARVIRGERTRRVSTCHRDPSPSA